MDDRRRQALTALQLVAAAAAGDESADSLLVDAFDSVEQAALALAYVNGFLVLLLADVWDVDPSVAVAKVERFVRAVEGGD